MRLQAELGSGTHGGINRHFDEGRDFLDFSFGMFWEKWIWKWRNNNNNKKKKTSTKPVLRIFTGDLQTPDKLKSLWSTESGLLVDVEPGLSETKLEKSKGLATDGDMFLRENVCHVHDHFTT